MFRSELVKVDNKKIHVLVAYNPIYPFPCAFVTHVYAGAVQGRMSGKAHPPELKK